MTREERLHNALMAVCPIDGVTIGSWDDRATWTIATPQEPTEAQAEALAAVIASFDPGPAPTV